MHELEKTASDKLLHVLSNIDGVQSVTIAGSLVDSGDLSSPSDIDTIVVCSKLTKRVFDQCVRAVESLTGADLGFHGRSVFVNSTLGPLKRDNSRVIVVHLMMYDLARHREHVLKSPFTCYDWERSPVHIGATLAGLYPVMMLQPRDFLQARRGLEDYLDDIRRGCISYRRYEFDSGAPREVVERKPLDTRRQGEYAFHIVKNLVANYLKLILRANRLLSYEEFVRSWSALLPACAEFIPFYETLKAVKQNGTGEYPPGTIARVKEFIAIFEDNFQRTWGNAPRLYFMRHAVTPLNDGSFLGQARDPGISDNAVVMRLDARVDKVYCSPLKRCVETARKLAPGIPVIEDRRLMEIDYGRAEGLSGEQMKQQHPRIVNGWQRGEDPCFPGGENTAMVLERLQSFLGDRRMEKGASLCVTHNVVLRCLMGLLFDIPMRDWYRLSIPHQELLEVINLDGRFHPNITANIKAALTDSLVKQG